MPDRLVHDIAAALLAAGVNPHGMTVIEAALALESFIRTDRDAAVEAARQEERQRCIDVAQSFVPLIVTDPVSGLDEEFVQLDDLLHDLAAAVPVPEEETAWMTCPECGGLGLHPEHNDRLCPTCFGKREVLRPVPEEENQP